MSSKKRPAVCLDDDSSSKMEPRKHTVTSISANNEIYGAYPRFYSDRYLKLLSILSKLEFRKAFLFLSYIGRNKIGDIVSGDDAVKLERIKDLPMVNFEENVWSNYGDRYLGSDSPDRINHHDWDSRRTHSYNCRVYQDGTYCFKGPCLCTTKSHLQRTLGDENILIVKFDEATKSSTNCAINSSDYSAMCMKIAKEGIVVGPWLYRLFGFKDGGSEEKKKDPFSSSVKFYFVRMESMAPFDKNETYILAKKTIHEARCLFMHIHTTSSMAKYVSRFSLILSKTIKLNVDLNSVIIEVIEDVPCRDQNGKVYEDGKRLIHTDGTGYIAEDLAMKCPKNIFSAKYMQDEQFEVVEKIKESAEKKYHVCEPPLLIQCRLFKNGLAVKGTLLLNRKLKSGTIQIRPSMIKVEADPTLQIEHSFNSLELVATSRKPKRCTLSKNLIALLSFGGVPKEFFLNILRKALEEAQLIFSNKRAALRFLFKRGHRDDVDVVKRMVMFGIPLDEPCVRNCLNYLVREEKKRLQRGKLNISESYYLMGTADPTGLLENDQVCVISGNGQVIGDVLVYRNPGLHFGDIHILKATYIEAIRDVVGNAKYAIFFSTRGHRSITDKIAGGDLDGDMYWVSQNHELLRYFKASPPWKTTYLSPQRLDYKWLNELSCEQLEDALMQQYLDIRKHSNNIWVAADNWLALMDRLLILGGDSPSEAAYLKKTMLQLVDIYYDSLDAAKSGKKVKVPKELQVRTYPHHMERKNTYISTSVLGVIYDAAQPIETPPVSLQEIWKLPKFEKAQVPHKCMMLWKNRYDDYLEEMSKVMKSDEYKHTSVDNIIRKYKQMLYEATAFEQSDRKVADIYNDALALYHVTYDHAKRAEDVGKCLFAWQVAGTALCKFRALEQT